MRGNSVSKVRAEEKLFEAEGETWGLFLQTRQGRQQHLVFARRYLGSMYHLRPPSQRVQNLPFGATTRHNWSGQRTELTDAKGPMPLHHSGF